MSLNGKSEVIVLKSGVVDEVLVREGQAIGKGAMLVTLSSNTFTKTGLEQDVYQQAMRRSDAVSLRQREFSAVQSLTAKLSDLDLQRTILLSQRREFETQILLQTRRLEATKERVGVAQNLYDKGYLAADELRRRKDAELDAQAVLSATNSNRNEIDYQLLRLEEEKQRVSAENSATVAAINGEIQNLNWQSVSDRAERGWSLKAPVAGIISNLKATRGQNLEAGSAVLTILPENPELIAEVYIPAKSVGFLKKGQNVRLLFDAFPYQKFGTFRGQVASISLTTEISDKISATTQMREPVYIVRVQLLGRQGGSGRQELKFREGMTLTADLILEQRSVLDWLLEPVTSSFIRTSEPQSK